MIVSVLILSLIIWGLIQGETDDFKSNTGEDREYFYDRLMSLGYIDYAYDDGDYIQSARVIVPEPGRVFEGYNLFTLLRSDTTYLEDLEGNIIHTWKMPNLSKQYAVLGEDLSLYVVQLPNNNLVKLDWDSNVIWEVDGVFHHDIHVNQKGRVITLDTVEREFMKGDEKHTIQDNRIVFISSDGIVERTISLFDILRDEIRLGGGRDPMHANTIDVIDRDLGYAKEGDLLTCIRHMNRIVIIEPENGTVRWMWGEGILQIPHMPTVLPDGNILVFDNGYPSRNHSRLLTVNPRNKEIVWTYYAQPKESFYTLAMGGAQALPNGNILITESNKGKAFEITKQGDIVWEYYSPREDEGKRKPIYRMTRIPKGEINEKIR
jgi:hypothetical protein